MAATGHADHVIDLHFAAGTDAETALNAGVEIDAHRDMAVVEQRDAALFELGEAALADALHLGHVPKVARFVMGGVARRLIRHEHFDHHLARGFGAGGVGLDHHAIGGFADAGGGKGPFAFDLDHAGAAIAIGAIARRGLVTQMGNDETPPVGHFPDGHAFFGRDLFAVEGKGDGVGHAWVSLLTGV